MVKDLLRRTPPDFGGQPERVSTARWTAAGTRTPAWPGHTPRPTCLYSANDLVGLTLTPQLFSGARPAGQHSAPLRYYS